MDAQTQQALETVKLLWIALGVLIVANFGVFFKFFVDKVSASKKAEKTEIQNLVEALNKNTQALVKFEEDMQRFYMAIKLVAGKKWPGISKIIQNEHPRKKPSDA
jgi:hypothetical protein